jgi:hypothetical protein
MLLRHAQSIKESVIPAGSNARSALTPVRPKFLLYTNESGVPENQ